MTIKQVAEQYEALINQCYDMDILVSWLEELEGKAVLEVFAGYSDNPAGEDWKERLWQSTGAELLIPPPYDRVYVDFLRMKNDSWNKESSYNNSAKAFNDSWKAFGNYWRRSHRKLVTPLRF